MKEAALPFSTPGLPGPGEGDRAFKWEPPCPPRERGDDTHLLSQALVSNIPYQPPHYLSPTYALLLQWTRLQLISHSLEFGLTYFWGDLGMVNHFPGTLIRNQLSFQKIILNTLPRSPARESVHAGHLVCNSIKTFLVLCGILAYSNKTVSSTSIPLKTGMTPYSWLAHTHRSFNVGRWHTLMNKCLNSSTWKHKLGHSDLPAILYAFNHSFFHFINI